MRFPEPPPDFPTVRQLRWWAVKHAPAVRRQLVARGISAGDLVRPIYQDPDVQETRATWQNRGPFPSDEAILLLMLLMTPRDQEVNAFDEKGLSAVVTAPMVMAAPDPMPGCVRVDVGLRRFVTTG